MPFEVSIELDVDGLWREATREIADGLRHAVKVACDEGARFSKESHPYRDRTYHLTDTTFGKLETFDRTSATGFIQWTQQYASYVDKGTSRSRPYPFVDQAVAHAEVALEFGVESVVSRAIEKLGRL